MAKKKTKTSKKVSKKSAKPTVGAASAGGSGGASGEVRVRMYRQGFGDCFLLRFEKGEEAPVHMLIDCGLLMGAPSAERVREVVKDIGAVTGGMIDIVVCTHEHVDHLSGFLHAKAEWEKITIGELWLAWTEDSTDELANQLRKVREERRKGLRKVALRLGAQGVEGVRQEVESALAFFGMEGLGAKGSTSDTAAALAFVRSRCAKPARYWSPGDVATHGKLPWARFFVMGPPRNVEMLKKDKPSASDPEVYHATGLGFGEAAFFAAAGGGVAGGVGGEKVLFDESYRLTEKEVEAAAKEGTPGATQSDAAYLHERYIANERIVEVGASRRKVGAKARTLKVEQGWRRIDRDWLSYAGALAMKLDEDTNNTSLVLAIELAGSGQVLLFPGDAQVGNWLSWDGCSWTVKEAGKPDRTVSAADLLGRTVLYKVGHHGSHNATLKALGLERMNGKRLVAMIPVDEAVAKKQGKFGWKMPFEPLLRALETKTEGRVLRADGAMPVVAGPEKKWFASAAKVTPLYAELMVKDE